jgi:hypothetical protein
MLVAITSDALIDCLSQDPFSYHPIYDARITTTNRLIDHYEEAASGSPTLKDFYQIFITSRHQSGKIKLVAGKDDNIFNNYLTSAISGGKNLIFKKPLNLDEEQTNELLANGIRVIPLSAPEYEGASAGHLPFERHNLLQDQQKDPREVIGHIFKNSRAAVFYDRHLNSEACSLIAALSNEMSADAEVTVITSTDARLTPTQIRNCIGNIGPRRLQVETATEDTRRFFHDRYIYVDDHYEIHLPRGLDCFGGHPRWRNRNSVIAIYDCSDSNSASFNCAPHAGRQSSKVITVRSALINV